MFLTFILTVFHTHLWGDLTAGTVFLFFLVLCQSLLGPVLLNGLGWKVSLVTGSEMKGRGQERHSQAQHGDIAMWNCVHVFYSLSVRVLLFAEWMSLFVFNSICASWSFPRSLLCKVQVISLAFLAFPGFSFYVPVLIHLQGALLLKDPPGVLPQLHSVLQLKVWIPFWLIVKTKR